MCDKIVDMKYGKLRFAWSAFFGILCVMLMGLWLRSYQAFDRASGKVFGRASAICVSYAGTMTAVLTEVDYLHWNWPKLDSGPILPNNWTMADLARHDVNWHDADVVWPYRGIMGFGWIQRAIYPNIPNSEVGWDPRGMSGRSWAANSTGFMVPHWFGVLIFASLARLPWFRWRFSLRTFLIATTLLAIFLGLIVRSFS